MYRADWLEQHCKYTRTFWFLPSGRRQWLKQGCERKSKEQGLQRGTDLASCPGSEFKSMGSWTILPRRLFPSLYGRQGAAFSIKQPSEAQSSVQCYPASTPSTPCNKPASRPGTEMNVECVCISQQLRLPCTQNRIMVNKTK